MGKNTNSKNNIDLSKVRKPVRKNIYSKAYLDILENNVFKISNMAKFLYMYLDARQGKNGFVYEKQENMAKKINISTRSLGTYLQELESINAVVKIQLHFKSNGNKFLDVIIPKEFNPFNLKFENIENLEEIKQDILKELPYCLISKAKGKRKSKSVDSVNSVKNSENKNSNKSSKDIGNTRVKSNKDPNCKNCSWDSNKPKRKICCLTKRKFYSLTIPRNGLKPLNSKCKICRTELKKILYINKRKLENIKSLSCDSPENVWEKIKIILKEQLSEVSYKTWIEQSVKNIKIKNDILVLNVVNNFSKGILEKNYLDMIKNAYKSIYKQNVDIKINDIN